MKKLATFTLGCKVNQYETRAVEEMFIKRGYQIVPFFKFADIYLINTCTVTSMSEKKSRQIIRRAKKLNPKSIVVVIGCYSQKEPEKILDMENVNLVLGTTDRNKIVDEVEKISNYDKKNIVRDVFEDKEFEEISIDSTSKHTRAFLKIQDGCDRYCSYCIIPYTRGRVRSKKINNIIEEVKSLAENGYKEIVLTGIHLASYGKDLENVSIINVIEEIEKIDKIERVRLGSIEPKLIDVEFLERIKKCNKFCPNFHISLQSGSDKTLKRMNRRYTTEEYYQSVEKIRTYFDNPVITTDIIVGFPGETEEEFDETYEFLKKIKFYQTHIFKYSRREGTKAYNMKNQIPSEIKNNRSKILLELSYKNKKQYEEDMIGRKEIILIEEKEGKYFTGHTKNFVKVYLKSNENLQGKIQKVKIIKLDEDKLKAEILSI